MRINAKHYTNEYILEKAKGYNSLKELRDESYAFYQLIRRRGLLDDVRQFFPAKKYSKRVRKLKDPKDELKPGPVPKPKVKKVVRTVQIYKPAFENDVKICGRCFQNEPKTPRSALCKSCQKIYLTKHAYEKEHVPWNLKQEYCNTTIRHYEKTFELGIRVDERLQNYLTLVGYGFIFQDPWEDLWK
jgi:hypothetical protein